MVTRRLWTGSSAFAMLSKTYSYNNLSWLTIFIILSSSTAFQMAPTTTITSRPSLTRLFSTPAPPAIQIENLSCSHNGGETWQLKDVNYVLSRNSKVALVGRNGAGKSTLMRILAENTCLDHEKDSNIKYSGKISCPRDVRVAYVEQEPKIDPELTVEDALLGFRTQDGQTMDNKSIYSVVRRYKRAVTTAEDDPEGFAKASAEMERVGGWSVLTKAEEVATKLRVRHLQDQKIGKLSGGEMKRVALAAALAQEPDVLLLDEPTNFLSLAGVQWLSDVLFAEQMTILMVTHDRSFLNEVCNTILELDNGSLYSYEGKYSDYLEGKAERIALEDAAVQAAKAKYRVELDWMRRQPQARETKQKARIDAFYKLEKATKPKPRDPKLLIENGGSQRMGTKILSMRNVNLKFGSRVILNDFSYDFCKGDRICLAGANGVGKTTFLRALTGALEVDSGLVEIGDTIVLGVYDQEGIEIDKPEQTVLEFVVEKAQAREGSVMSETPGEARRLLQQFEFPRSRWNERLSVLSGGEKRRLQMLEVFSKRPNFLIMDEPSVDCDLDTLQALESYLQDFSGVLLTVSHDKMFADNVADHLFVFEGNGEIRDFQGTLSEYASTLVELENEALPGGGQSTTAEANDTSQKKQIQKEEKQKRNETRNIVRNARKEMDKLEKSIEKLKAKEIEIQSEIDATSPDAGWSVLAELTGKQSKLHEEIDEKEMAWMEYAELVEASEVEV